MATRADDPRLARLRAEVAARRRSGAAVTTGPTTVIVPDEAAMDTIRQAPAAEREQAPDPRLDRLGKILATRSRGPSFAGVESGSSTAAASPPSFADVRGGSSTRSRPPEANHPLATVGEYVLERAKAIPRGIGRGVQSGGALLESLAVAQTPSAEERATYERLGLDIGDTEAGKRRARTIQGVGATLAEAPELRPSRPRGAITELVDDAIQTVPQIGAAIAGGVVAGPAGFALPIFALEGGNAYLEAKERLARTMPVEEAERQAAVVGAVVGAGNTILESALGVGVGNLFGRLPVVRQFFRKEILKRAPLRIAGTAFEEGLEEAVQGAWNATAQFAASQDPEVWQEFVQSAPREALVGGIVGAGFGAANVGLGAEEDVQGLLSPEEVQARLDAQDADELARNLAGAESGTEPPPRPAAPPAERRQPENTRLRRTIDTLESQPVGTVVGPYEKVEALAGEDRLNWKDTRTGRPVAAVDVTAELGIDPILEQFAPKASERRTEGPEVQPVSTGSEREGVDEAPPAGPLVDDLTARRAGIPPDLTGGINLLGAEHDFAHAVLTKGAKVRLPDGGTGTVVQPLTSYDELTGGAQEAAGDATVLVETPEGQKRVRALDLEAVERAPREFVGRFQRERGARAEPEVEQTSPSELPKGLSVIQNPAGSWSFAGFGIPGRLLYEQKDGSPATEDQLKKARQFGPALAGVKLRAFPTREAAIAAFSGEPESAPATAPPPPGESVTEPRPIGKSVEKGALVHLEGEGDRVFEIVGFDNDFGGRVKVRSLPTGDPAGGFIDATVPLASVRPAPPTAERPAIEGPAPAERTEFVEAQVERPLPLPEAVDELGEDATDVDLESVRDEYQHHRNMVDGIKELLADKMIAPKRRKKLKEDLAHARQRVEGIEAEVERIFGDAGLEFIRATAPIAPAGVDAGAYADSPLPRASDERIVALLEELPQTEEWGDKVARSQLEELLVPAPDPVEARVRERVRAQIALLDRKGEALHAVTLGTPIDDGPRKKLLAALRAAVTELGMTPEEEAVFKDEKKGPGGALHAYDRVLDLQVDRLLPKPPGSVYEIGDRVIAQAGLGVGMWEVGEVVQRDARGRFDTYHVLWDHDRDSEDPVGIFMGQTHTHLAPESAMPEGLEGIVRSEADSWLRKEGRPTPEERKRHDEAHEAVNELGSLTAYLRQLAGETPAPKAAPSPSAPPASTVPVERVASFTRGRETVIIDADGKQIAAHFALVALEDEISSHDSETFAPNPEFPQVFQGRTLDVDKAAQAEIVKQSEQPKAELLLDLTTRPTDGPEIMTPSGLLIAGRSRNIIKRRALRRGKLGEYIEQVKAQAAQFGIDPAAVDALIAEGKTPSIVRVLDPASVDVTDPAVLDDLSRRFDLPPTKRMDAAGEAAQRARNLERAPNALGHLNRTLMEDATVRQYLESPEGRQFLKLLVEENVISGRELGALVDATTGMATAEGKAFVENLLLAAAVGDPRTITRAPDGILYKLEHSTPALVASGQFEGWDLRPTLREALDLLAAVRSAGHKSVDDFIAQQDIFEREYAVAVVDMARFLDEKGKKQVTEGFRAYAHAAASANRASESEDLFGYEPPSPEEARAKHVRDPGRVYQISEGEAAFGSEEAAEQLSLELIEEVGEEFVTTSRGPLASSGTRMGRIRGHKKRRAWLDIRGKVMATREDAFRLLRPFRSPKYERLHFVLTDDAGRVLSHEMTTVGAINYVTFYPPYQSAPGVTPEDKDNARARRFARQIARRARRVGATRIILAHNHPSGDPTPSREDRQVTLDLGGLLAPHRVRLAGQLVMDDTEASFIFADGTTEVVQLPSAEAGPRDWTEIHGPDVNSPNKVAELFAGMASPERVDVVYISNRNAILAVEPHSPLKVLNVGEWLPERIRGHGASRAILVTGSRDAWFAAVHAQQGAADAARALQLAGEEPSYADGPLADIMYISPHGQITSSAADQGKIARTPTSRARAPRRLREERAPYGGRPGRPRALREGAGVEGESVPETGSPESGREDLQERLTPESAFSAIFGAGGGPAPSPEQVPISEQIERPVDLLDPAAPIATARLQGRLAAPPKGAVRPVSAPEVIKSFAEIVKAAGRDVPIRTGRLGTKRARGIFKVRAEVIRVGEANNIPTAAHEVAHALEKAVFGYPKGGPWKKPTADRVMQKELVKLGKALYGSTKPAGGYKREGFAEFLRLYLTTDTDAKTKAPVFHSWFEGEFLVRNDDIRKAVNGGRARAKRWREQGSLERARQSMVDTGTVKAQLGRAAREIRRAVSYDGLIEMAQPLHELAREAERRRGKELAPSEDPFFLTAALRTVHSSRVRYMIERGMIDLAGNRVGPALDEIRPLVEGRQRDFTIYLWAKRAEALWLDPNRPGGRNPGLSLEDAQQIITELGSVEFELAAGKVYAWNDGILNYAAQSSPTFAAIVKKIRAVDPGFYIPLQREFAELDNLWARSARGPASRSSPVKRLRGSGRRIKDPFQAMVANAGSTLRAAHQRAVIEQIVKLSQVEGMGRLIEQVPHDQVPVAHATIEEILERVHRLAGLGPGEDVQLTTPFDTPLDHLLGEVLTFFAPASFPKGQDPIIPIFEQGRVNWYYVDEGLYGALEAIDVYRLPAILEWTLGTMAGMFRAGTTALRPAFGLVTNPSRDIQTMYVNSQSRSRGPALFGAWVKALGSALAVRTTGKGASVYLDAFLRLGGEMAQPLGQDIPHTRRAAQRLFAGRTARLIDPRNWYDGFRDLIQVPESAPRVAELERVAKDIGWEPGQPMTLDQSLILLLAAKQVTTDFTAAGRFGRAMNRVVPFFNAAFQGPRATVRAGRRNPTKVLARGLALSILTAWLWWDQKDEDWYREMPFRERFLNWHFPVDVGDSKELVRIPRAFEIGMVFSAFPEMLLDAWYTNDPEGVRAYFETLYKTSSPGFLPVPVEEAAEQLANRDFFFERPIVPRGEEDMPAEEQFNEYTSRAAIFLGETFGLSPRRIDHAIRGVFGGTGGDVVELLGLGAAEIEREGEPSDLPIIGKAFTRGGREGVRSRYVDTLYDRLGKAVERQRSKKNPETESERQLRLQMQDAADAVSALSYVRQYTPGRAQRNAITREINALAAQAVAAAKAGTLDRTPFTTARKAAEAREEALKGGGAEPESDRRPLERRQVESRRVQRRAVERR